MCTNPGETTVTRRSPTSCRSPSQTVRTAVFVAAYTDCRGTVRYAAVDATVTTWPAPCRRKTGSAAAMPYRTPRRLTSIISSHSSTRSSASGERGPTHALLTSTSSLPKASSAVSTRRAGSSRRRTSVGTPTARPPRARMSAASPLTRSPRRAPRTTAAPRSANASAVARPMPLPAPVTATTLSQACAPAASVLGADSTVAPMSRGAVPPRPLAGGRDELAASLARSLPEAQPGIQSLLILEPKVAPTHAAPRRPAS